MTGLNLHQSVLTQESPNASQNGDSAGSCDGAGKIYAPVDEVNTPASTKATPQKFCSEAELETAISAAMARMCAAPTREGKMREWREMCALIDQRTPERMRFMARVRGLA